MFMDFLCTDVSHLVMFMPTKGNSIMLGYFHSKVEVLVTRVQFIEKNVGFAAVRLA